MAGADAILPEFLPDILGALAAQQRYHTRRLAWQGLPPATRGPPPARPPSRAGGRMAVRPEWRQVWLDFSG
eukprot:2133918-Pleurochrysis_carterae.AAC.1